MRGYSRQDSGSSSLKYQNINAVIKIAYLTVKLSITFTTVSRFISFKALIMAMLSLRYIQLNSGIFDYG
jgi:hypothetical protein